MWSNLANTGGGDIINNEEINVAILENVKAIMPYLEDMYFSILNDGNLERRRTLMELEGNGDSILDDIQDNDLHLPPADFHQEFQEFQAAMQDKFDSMDDKFQAMQDQFHSMDERIVGPLLGIEYKVLEKTKKPSIMVFSQVQGQPINVTIELQRYAKNQELVSVLFDQKVLAPGTVVLELMLEEEEEEEDAGDILLLLLKAMTVGDDNADDTKEHTTLISFD